MRHARLWSGLVMFAYVVSHLFNHALALVSLELANAWLSQMMNVWANVVGRGILTSALVVHVGVGLGALATRQSLRMPAANWVMTVTGLVIPPVLFAHLGETVAAKIRYGVSLSYTVELRYYFLDHPGSGVILLSFLALVWVHACLGLHQWLRITPRYPRVQPYLLVAAVVFPLLSCLGVLTGVRELRLLMDNPARWPGLERDIVFLPAQVLEDGGQAFRSGVATVLALLLVVAAVRWSRRYLARRHGTLTVTYDTGHRVVAQRGMTILEASRQGRVPHTAVCGGRGRCSTCRVRVVHDAADSLNPPSADELRVLDRVGAPPNVRLACQARPERDVLVSPLVPLSVKAHLALRKSQVQGQEMEIAILFSDLRGFTRMSEKKLPYDLVYILNRYCTAMGEAVEAAGGQVDKFIGDGVMALFGIRSGPEQGCRQALHAARLMAGRLTDLNAVLASDLKEPLRMGIGVHTGPAVVGEIGYGDATSLTAIGDSVNTASRLESMTKELQCQLAVSEQVAQRAGIDLTGFPQHQVQVRGRAEPLVVYAVTSAADVFGGESSPRHPAVRTA